MNIDRALAYLDEHINLEATAGRVEGLSLAPITELLAALGDPHTAYPVIHVTGTNGKGSVVAMISQLLQAHGLSVGTYTSPHLVRVNERLTRNGEPISDDELAEAIDRIARIEQVTGLRPSYFEILTAAALGWFADTGVEVAVVEVGLLGRWDATNVVDAAVAVITNVGKDHTDGAEGWRAKVAAEKAGIIKPGSDVVLGEPDVALRPIFEAEPAATMAVRPVDFEVTGNQLAVGGRLVDLRTPRATHADLFVPLHGAHQADNAAVAVTAVEALFDRAVDDDVLAEGFAELALPGRFEIVRRSPMVVLDGAHNPSGAAALARTLGDFNVARRIFVLGVLGGRDVDEVVGALGLVPGDLVVACAPDNERAVPATVVADAVARAGVSVDVVEDVVAAVDEALAMAGEEDAVIVAGSLYVVGAARPHLVDAAHEPSTTAPGDDEGEGDDRGDDPWAPGDEDDDELDDAIDAIDDDVDGAGWLDDEAFT